MTEDKQGEYFAACTLGLEEVLAREITELGGSGVEPGRGGVRFAGTRAFGYRAALWLRTAVRLQEKLGDAEVLNEQDLYDFVRGIDWEERMKITDTLAVDASVRDAVMTHSQYVAQRVKDAVVDQFRERTRKRPNVDPKRPTLPLKLHLQGERATLYRDLAGDSMHKRGYRPIQVKSPLNEATAAGLVLMSNWDRKSPLVDPMCGSGTIGIEAAYIATDRAPGLRRKFAFERWPDFDADAWRSLLEDAMKQSRGREMPPIELADRHPGAIEIAKESIRMAGLNEKIRLTHADLREFDPMLTPSVVICNPPYGERIGRDDSDDSWRDLGDFLRELCGGSTAWILSGAPALGHAMRLKASRKFPIRNGPIDCRLLRYEIGLGGRGTDGVEGEEATNLPTE